MEEEFILWDNEPVNVFGMPLGSPTEPSDKLKRDNKEYMRNYMRTYLSKPENREKMRERNRIAARKRNKDPEFCAKRKIYFREYRQRNKDKWNSYYFRKAKEKRNNPEVTTNSAIHLNIINDTNKYNGN